jgi:hypothetical protein
MILVAIDPGEDAGVAVFVGGRLVAARLVDGRTARGVVTHADLVDVSGPAEVVVELPQAYTGGRSRAPIHDLVTLAYRAGRLAQAAEAALRPGVREVTTETVWPAQWKGSVDKRVVNARVAALLNEAETAAVRAAAAGARAHNVLDAVGLGLWRLKRMSRGGTKP